MIVLRTRNSETRNSHVASALWNLRPCSLAYLTFWQLLVPLYRYRSLSTEDSHLT